MSDGNIFTLNSTEKANTENEIFSNLITSSCNDENREMDVLFDVMPTISFQNNAIITLAFTGQRSKMSCEKVRKTRIGNIIELIWFFCLAQVLYSVE